MKNLKNDIIKGSEEIRKIINKAENSWLFKNMNRGCVSHISEHVRYKGHKLGDYTLNLLNKRQLKYIEKAKKRIEYIKTLYRRPEDKNLNTIFKEANEEYELWIDRVMKVESKIGNTKHIDPGSAFNKIRTLKGNAYKVEIANIVDRLEVELLNAMNKAKDKTGKKVKIRQPDIMHYMNIYLPTDKDGNVVHLHMVSYYYGSFYGWFNFFDLDKKLTMYEGEERVELDPSRITKLIHVATKKVFEQTFNEKELAIYKQLIN